MKLHIATIHDARSTGVYVITCDACTFRQEGPMTRNEAHHVAYMHTMDAVS